MCPGLSGRGGFLRRVFVWVVILSAYTSAASAQQAVAGEAQVDASREGVILAARANNAIAAEPAQGSSESEKRQSIYDKIWKFAEWYESDSNPVVQRVLFSGRYQHEYVAL